MHAAGCRRVNGRQDETGQGHKKKKKGLQMILYICSTWNPLVRCRFQFPMLGREMQGTCRPSHEIYTASPSLSLSPSPPPPPPPISVSVVPGSNFSPSSVERYTHRSPGKRYKIQDTRLTLGLAADWAYCTVACVEADLLLVSGLLSPRQPQPGTALFAAAHSRHHCRGEPGNSVQGIPPDGLGGLSPLSVLVFRGHLVPELPCRPLKEGNLAPWVTSTRHHHLHPPLPAASNQVTAPLPWSVPPLFRLWALPPTKTKPTHARHKPPSLPLSVAAHPRSPTTQIPVRPCPSSPRLPPHSAFCRKVSLLCHASTLFFPLPACFLFFSSLVRPGVAFL